MYTFDKQNQTKNTAIINSTCNTNPQAFTLWDQIDLRLNFSWHCCVTEVDWNKEKKVSWSFQLKNYCYQFKVRANKCRCVLEYCTFWFLIGMRLKNMKKFRYLLKAWRNSKVNSTFLNLKGIQFAHSICSQQSFMIRMLQYVEFVCKQLSHTLAAHYFR